jgi:hypothetical protein
MQEVQTCMRLVLPFTIARTRWMLGFQRRFVRTWEWLIVMPNEGFFPQTSHTAAMTANHLSSSVVAARRRDGGETLPHQVSGPK